MSEPELTTGRSSVEDELMEEDQVAEVGRQQSEGVDTNDDDHEGEVDDDENEGEGEDEDDDEEDDDEDEESDEDDDDDDEDDEESEEEHDRMRARVLRRSVGGSSRRSQLQRLWGGVSNENSAGELEEVDEDEFSYVRILEDEVALGREQQRRAMSNDESNDRNQGANGQVARSLVDLFSLDGGFDEAGAGGFVFGDFDDDEEDDPDTVFRNPLLRHRDMLGGAELRRKLHVSFTGEEGIDAGGVTREWYVILAREIFNPNYVLFTSAADSPTFQPNPLSYVNKDHLQFFEFVGKVIGKAVADGQLLDAHFTRSFYKHILQLPISYHDMEAIDPEYYRNLHSILDNPIADLGLELTFSAEQSNFGRMEIVDLIPNGRHVAVTDENKMEYVKLVTHHRMATGIRQQIDAFLKGFHQLVPPELIAIFNENELELLISGMPEIDIDDLKSNTEYANYKPTDPVIRWFWNVLYTFNHEERALFLQFVTGTSKVPLEGFKALEGMRGTQKFNIHKAFGNPNALPSAHTCFNQLDLPEYESEEKLRQCLLLAIREGSEGFGFG
ncbi:hypothetical protein ATCC90586_005949 [Pythium insidiosum]|nr:hypothetical protein ATCC90586_005949 [Pythium insidiosum]